MQLPVWRSATGECLLTFIAHGGQVHHLVISPDGKWLATVGHEGAIAIWDAATGQPTTLMRTDGPLIACRWNRDGRMLAVTGEKGLYLYDFYPGSVSLSALESE